MGLAASQARLLMLTNRKADCEFGISMNSMRKMALTREMSDLTREYNSKLQTKQISFYANGKYNKVNYQYLMGYGSNWLVPYNNSLALKKNNSMVLSDYKGQVILSKEYANAITKVLSGSAMNANGQGGTFSKSKIPEILAVLMPGLNADQIKSVMDGDSTKYTYSATSVKTLTGEVVESGTTHDATAKMTEIIQTALDFYLPIFEAAANNGWTTEYNDEINTNPDYISDAIVSGTFQLETVDEYGDYDEGTSLLYFLTNGAIEQNTSSETREDITAWYDAEKARISEKEDWLDIENRDLSTELEAINTEIQAVQTLINDAISSVFDWGNA